MAERADVDGYEFSQVSHDEVASEPAAAPPLFEPRQPHATAREKLRAFLDSRPAGADSRELLALLFSGAGSDPELGERIVRGLLESDSEFVFNAASGLWSLRAREMLRVPLDEARFTVVDLETTGMRPGPGAIIEIGAWRMVGRRVTDSFQTLVRPRAPISRFITGLTSITNQMLADAPHVEDVLPAFRDFMGDSVMVAHNARFDHSFLDFEFRRLFGLGVRNPLLCTLRMARKFVPSLKRRRLDLLAEHFGLSTAGRHRGLGDARMAAEILSIFLEIAEQMGFRRLDLLLDSQQRGRSGRRIERHVAPEVIAALPLEPGVYLMRNQRGDLLYVGKARKLRERVTSYFTSSVDAKTAELVSHVYDIETRVTASALEAALLESELIRELKPPFNRMLKSAAPAYFIKLDMMDEYPRLVLSQKMSARAGVMHLGPFIGRRSLDQSMRALGRVLGLRTCTGKLEPGPDVSPCIYGQMGHCAAPCNLTVSADAYADRVRKAFAFLRGRSGAVLGDLVAARDQAARMFRYEEASRYARELKALATLANRASRLSQVVTENNLVIVTGEGASRTAHVVLSGRLAASCPLDGDEAAASVTKFVAQHYERYRLARIAREELERMTIVARWLRERAPDEGRLVYLGGPALDARSLVFDEAPTHSAAVEGMKPTVPLRN